MAFSRGVQTPDDTMVIRVLHAFWLKGRPMPPPFTNNMIFLECGVIALFEAFYMLRDHNHVKMKF